MADKSVKGLKYGDRVKAGFTWYTVTSVEGDVVYAAERPGLTPRRLRLQDIREVVGA